MKPKERKREAFKGRLVSNLGSKEPPIAGGLELDDLKAPSNPFYENV